MGLFTPFIYTSKKTGKKFWLHMKKRGNATLYYFSKDPTNALKSLPPGFEVVENPTTGMPFLRKKKSKGFLAGIFGRAEKKPEEEKKEEEKKE